MKRLQIVRYAPFVLRLRRVPASLLAAIVAALVAAPAAGAHGGLLDAHGAAPFPAWVTDVVFLGVPTVALVVGLLVLEQRTRPPEHPRRPQGGR